MGEDGEIGDRLLAQCVELVGIPILGGYANGLDCGAHGEFEGGSDPALAIGEGDEVEVVAGENGLEYRGFKG